MSNPSRAEEDRIFQERALDAAIRISLLALLVLWCFNIIRPFIMPILWGAIMAVAIYPLYVKAHHKLGGGLYSFIPGNRLRKIALINLFHGKTGFC